MKKIILATDFSRNAKNAIEYGIQLFGIQGVNYIIVNSFVEPKATTNVVVSMNDLLRKESIKGLKVLEHSLTEQFPSISLDSRSLYGSIASVIEQITLDEKVYCVVAGTKGLSALERFVMGSSTLDIIKNVKLPVLLVPEGSAFHSIERVALAADYHHMEQVQFLSPLIDIISEQDAELKIVHVHTSNETLNDDEASEDMKLHNMFLTLKHEICSELNTDVVLGILAFTERNEIQMLAMIARKHTFFDRLFHKSITKEMTKLSRLPYLVLHE